MGQEEEEEEEQVEEEEEEQKEKEEEEEKERSRRGEDEGGKGLGAKGLLAQVSPCSRFHYTPTHLPSTIFYPMKISCTLLIVNLCKAIIVYERSYLCITSRVPNVKSIEQYHQDENC